jgi:hypothetical protein
MERMENKIDFIVTTLTQVQVALARLEVVSEAHKRHEKDLESQKMEMKEQKKVIEVLVQESAVTKAFATKREVWWAYAFSIIGIGASIVIQYFQNKQ